jgi:Tat protein translocase TatB subunit
VLNVGTPELLVILLVALIVLGPEKLPEVARQVGKVVGELRRMSAGFQAEMRDAIKEPLDLPPVDTTPDEAAPREADAGDEIPADGPAEGDAPTAG